jgi:hypothetical protein
VAEVVLALGLGHERVDPHIGVKQLEQAVDVAAMETVEGPVHDRLEHVSSISGR